MLQKIETLHIKKKEKETERKEKQKIEKEIVGIKCKRNKVSKQSLEVNNRMNYEHYRNL